MTRNFDYITYHRSDGGHFSTTVDGPNANDLFAAYTRLYLCLGFVPYCQGEVGWIESESSSEETPNGNPNAPTGD